MQKAPESRASILLHLMHRTYLFLNRSVTLWIGSGGSATPANSKAFRN
jgi:hypothetical protein